MDKEASEQEINHIFIREQAARAIELMSDKADDHGQETRRVKRFKKLNSGPVE